MAPRKGKSWGSRAHSELDGWQETLRSAEPAARQQFRDDWYRATYGNSVPPSQDAWRFFCSNGWRMGHDPNPTFSTLNYLKAHQDVKQADINPFLHYVAYGRAEGRTCSGFAPPQPASDLYAGRIDLVEVLGSKCRVTGWVATTHGGSYSLQVNGAPLLLVLPTLHRQDVSALGLGDGPNGFCHEFSIEGLWDFDPSAVRLASPLGLMIGQSAPQTREFILAVRDEDGFVRAETSLLSASQLDDLKWMWGERDVSGLAEKSESTLTDDGIVKYWLEIDGLALRNLEGATDIRADGSTLRLFVSGECMAEVQPSSYPTFRLFRDTSTAGWLVRNGAPNQVVELEALIDGVHFAYVRNDGERSDLRQKGISGGRGGFQIPLDLEAGPERTVTLELRLRATAQTIDSWPVVIGPRKWSGSGLLRRTRKTQIVVPIFRASDSLRRCIQALERSTPASVPIILIDDASNDPAVDGVLDEVGDRGQFRVVRHAQNLGFTKTANEGICLTDPDDVILLNSDTQVFRGWLQRLHELAYSSVDIATVTPVSNAAGAFSVPEIGMRNGIPDHVPLEYVSRLVAREVGDRTAFAPTGNGFCLYLRRDALDEVGALDEHAFPRGYGEENDLCMRMVRAGWRHAVDGRTWVFHERGSSFLEEKDDLVGAAQRQIHARYPEYRGLVARFVSSPDMHEIRYRVRRALSGSMKHLKPRIAFLIATATGGTAATNQDLMRSLQGQYETFVIQSHQTGLIRLSKFDGSALELLEDAEFEAPSLYTPKRTKQSEHIARWLSEYDIQTLHIRHLAWSGLDLPGRVKRSGRSVILSLHDYYAVCPSLNLLDDQGEHCGGLCTPGSEGSKCQAKLYSLDDVPPLKHSWVGEWRQLWSETLQQVDRVVVSSSSTAIALLHHYPDLGDRLSVIEHGRDFAEFARPNTDDVGRGGPLHVALAGRLDGHKGAAVVRDAIPNLRDLDVHLHVFGSLDISEEEVAEHQDVITVHGPYARDDLVRVISAVGADVGAVLSTCPETYSHVLTELWAAGLPVIGSDLGAVGERIRRHGGGWPILPTAEAFVEALSALQECREEVVARAHEVEAWQKTHVRSVKDMAFEYRKLYRIARTEGTDESTVEPLRLAVIAPGDLSEAPVSTHVRLIGRLRDAETRGIFTDWMPRPEVPNVDWSRYDLALVLRDGVPREHVDRFIEELESVGTPFMLDLDDDLLNVPPSLDQRGRYGRYAPHMKRLIRDARIVTGSSRQLVEKLKALRQGSQTVLVPNYLDEYVWLGLRYGVGPELTIPSDHAEHFAVSRLLYLAQSTHDQEIEFLADVMRSVTSPSRVEVLVPGWTKPLPQGFRALRPTSRNYPQFVNWLRNDAPRCVVGLAPLMSGEFNECKSNLKFLDYSALGLPGLFSDVPAYRDSVEHGVTGLLLPNDPQCWAQEISWVLSHEARARDLAHAAFASVSQEWLLSQHQSEWDELLRSVSNLRR